MLTRPVGSILLPGQQVLISVPIPTQTTRICASADAPQGPYGMNGTFTGGTLPSPQSDGGQ
jgi:hypothetical protein